MRRRQLVLDETALDERRQNRSSSNIKPQQLARLVVLRPCPSQKWPCRLQPGERKLRNTRPILCLLLSATHPEATRRQDTPCTTPAAHDDLFVSSSSIAGPQLKHIGPVLRGSCRAPPDGNRAPTHQSAHAGLNLFLFPVLPSVSQVSKPGRPFLEEKTLAWVKCLRIGGPVSSLPPCGSSPTTVP